MKKLFAAFALTAALTAGASANAATNLITNGDFTSLVGGVGQLNHGTTATGWSVNPGSTNSYEFVFTNANNNDAGQYGSVKLWTQADGGANSWNGLTKSGTGNFVALDGAFQDSPLSQTVSGLTVGAKYTLTFDYGFAQQYGFSGATTQNIGVSFGGSPTTVVGSISPLASHGFSGWSTGTMNFTATSSSEVLSFLSVASPQNPPFALVSNVSLVRAVPEPSTWAMMLIGFGGLGAVARMRKRQVAFA